MATPKTEKAPRKTVDNLVPEAFRNEGFSVRLNPEPVYYSPLDAGPFIGIVLDRQVELVTDPKYGNERIYYTAVALEDFTNGRLESGEPQPNAKRGEIIRIGEKAQFKQLSRIAGKALVVAIVPQGKVAVKGGKSCWTFQIYGKPATQAEIELARSSCIGGFDVPQIEETPEARLLTE